MSGTLVGQFFPLVKQLKMLWDLLYSMLYYLYTVQQINNSKLYNS